jgi:acyl dehydratase
MPANQKLIGKEYGPTTYVVGAEKLREFAYAISGGVPSMGFTGTGAPAGLNPVLHDDAAGKDSPHGSIIGLPNFAVVFSIAPFGQAVTDPELGIDLLMLVHGEQEFEFFDVIKPGDVMTSTGKITEIYEKVGKDFVVVQTESKNQHGKLVVKGTWTAVIRRA